MYTVSVNFSKIQQNMPPLLKTAIYILPRCFGSVYLWVIYWVMVSIYIEILYDIII